MRIGFDAKRLYNNFTGLGNYSRFMVEALSKFYPDNDCVLFTPNIKSNPDTRFFLEAKNIETVLPPAWISSLKLKSFWRSFMISSLVNKMSIDVYHGLSHELPRAITKRTKTVVTVHDLIFLRYPQFYNPIDIIIYKAKINHACKVADRVIAISEQTKQDIIDFLKVSPDKVTVIYQGCHPNFRRVPSPAELSTVKAKYDLPDEFILNVGTIEPRKNVLQILKALQLLKGKLQVPLVIVGRPTKYIEEIDAYVEKHGSNRQVKYIHNADFMDLPAIYRLSKVFVYPSLFEGFGIPLVEAIACEVPVITSTGSCFLEAAGPHSIYVDPSDDEALAFQLLEVLKDKDRQKNMVEQSTLFIKRFEPQIISKDLIELYSSLISKEQDFYARPVK